MIINDYDAATASDAATYTLLPNYRSVTTLYTLYCLVQLFMTPWTVAFQAPLSMGFPRQEYWSAISFSNTLYTLI